MRPILEVYNLGKRYNISHQTGGYLSLRERAFDLFRKGTAKEEFWALKDVSFEVNPGDSVGIIGRNGAGKSTLLKILSKITPPTKGRTVARGRIASLLEVGTGFHPELTGRENIFFNGSLLGMKRIEIVSKFDEIVSFSGVERFLDTPIKHYSSGMQLRLAFAVAAFLDPEILIIDEVLAVGDAEFQKKCLGKMEDVSKSGRTILFVSHNIPFVNSLCRTGILMANGKIARLGATTDVIDEYLALSEQQILSNLLLGVKYSCDYFHLTKLEIPNHQAIYDAQGKGELIIDVEFALDQESVVELEFHIRKSGDYVASYGNFLRHKMKLFPKGTHRVQYRVYIPDLLSGHYTMDLHFTHPLVKGLASIDNVAMSEIVNKNLAPSLNNDLRNWSKVILHGEIDCMIQN